MRPLLCGLAALLLGACRGGAAARQEPSAGPDSGGGDSGSQDPPRLLENGPQELVFGGLTRSFRLYRPAAAPDGAPLVFALHGYGGNAAGFQGWIGLDAIADREGFVVVYPQGSADAWDSNYWEVGYAFHDGSVDDVGFLREVARLVIADQGLDAGAVFATGLSNGGDMSYRLACEADDLFGAVVPVAGSLMQVLAEGCDPDHQPSLLEIHGTLDRITPWEGDPAGLEGYGPYYGTEDSVGFFVERYGLDLYAEQALPDRSTDDGSTVLARRWSSASQPGEVWLYEVQGGGHDWPGAGGNEDISASEEAWSFFSRRLDRP